MVDMLCIDIETTGLHWGARILSVAVAYRDSDTIVTKAWNVTAYDLLHSPIPITEIRSELKKLILQSNYVVGHNLSYDLGYLLRDNLIDANWVDGKLIDTLILARMTKAFESVSLYNVACDYGIYDPIWKKMKERRGTLINVDVDTLFSYNEKDVYYNLIVAEKLLSEAKTIYTMEKITYEGTFSLVVALMRYRGIAVDFVKLENAIIDHRSKERHHLFNVLLPLKIEGGNDAYALTKYLERESIPINRFTAKGKEKTDEETLHEIMLMVAHASGVNQFTIPDEDNDYTLDPNELTGISTTNYTILNTLTSVLAHRHYSKALSTWLEKTREYAQEDGLIHALYGAGGTVSYRLNCAEPNLQAFKAYDIWKPYRSGDYSQAEYRLNGMYSQSNTLARNYAMGDDAHSAIAKVIFHMNTVTKAQRKVGKAFNFAMLYFAGIPKLMAMTGLSAVEVNKIKKTISARLPEIGSFAKEVNKRWAERGYIVLWDGTRIWATDYDREKRGYKGNNQICQGGVAKIAQAAMMEFHKRGVPVIGQIHDSLQFPMSVDPDEARYVMENVLIPALTNRTTPSIPMVVDFEVKGESHE